MVVRGEGNIWEYVIKMLAEWVMRMEGGCSWLRIVSSG
jgi:hypothetical protein